jgi:dCMP deaminase
MKDKFISAHMKAAQAYAELSSAKRLQVGCVIVKDNTIIGIGYNGMPSGWDNNCEVEIHEEDLGNSYLKTRPEVLHAETNAIAKVAKSTNSTDGADMFITHAPCLECAKLIHQAGIKNIWFDKHYRDESGINFLQKCNIGVNHVGQNIHQQSNNN